MSDFESWFGSGGGQGDKPDQAGSVPAPASQPAAPDTGSDFTKWISGQEGDQRLGFSMEQARQSNPDLRAEVFRLQGKTGLPAPLIQRNLDRVRAEAEKQDFDPVAYRRDFPKLAGLMEDPDNAALSADDQEALKALERTIRNDKFGEMGSFEWLKSAPVAAYREGRLAEQRNNLAFQQFMGDESADLDAKLTEAESKLGTDFGADNFFSQALVDASQFLPSTIGGLVAGAETGVMGATATGGAALALGAISGPAAPATASLTLGAGFVAGSRVGASKYAFEQEAGASYREFSQFRDNDGVLMDKGTARVAATVSASINSGLEVLGLESLVKSFPGGAAALEGISRQSIKQSLRNPAVRDAFSNIAKRFGSTWSVQTATEVAQEAMVIVVGETAKSLSEQDFKGMTGNEFRDRMTETFRQAISGTAFLSLPGPSAGFVRDLGRARAAKNSRDTMEAIGEHAKASKLRERVPEKYREFVATIKEGGDTDNVYIPVERFNQAFEAAGLDPREVVNEVNGSYQAHTEAMANGGDIAIPLERYAEKLAGSDYHQTLLDDVRFRPEDMTAREARQFERDAPAMIDSMMADQDADTSRAVYDDQMGQLIASGRDRSAAESEATLMQSVFRSLGERTGQDPAELYNSFNIGVRRPLPDILTSRLDTDISVDPLLDRLRSKDVPRGNDESSVNLRSDMNNMSRYLEELGIDVDSSSNQQIRDAIDGVQSSFDRDVGNGATDGATTLQQNDGQPRGQIAFNSDRSRFDISLFDRANLSTYLHETGHLYLEVVGELAQRDDAPQQIREDYRTILNWFASSSSGALFKPVPNSAQLNSERLSNFAIAKPEGSKSEGFISAESVLGMLRDVRFAVNDPKVLDSVIASFPVDMVDMLGSDKRSAKMALHDNSVLQSIFSVNPNHDVPITSEGANLLAGVLRAIASSTAEGSPVSDSGRGDRSGGAASRANDSNGHTGSLGEVSDADINSWWNSLPSKERTQFHEQFARGWEQYLREGKAPSAGLQQAFSRFRAWLTSVYRSMKELNVNLSDDVRGVFDRLVATDQEISEARERSGHDPVFADAESAGMTATEYRDYRRMAEKARDEAEETLTNQAMQEYQRERKRWWRDEKSRVRDEVAGEVNQRPVYVALSMLGRSKMPDGSDLPYGMKPIKLSRTALVDMYGADYIKRLPRPYVYSREGGMHPDMAAEIFGYRSGDQMIKDMVDARPRRKLIEAETNRRMGERHGDMLTDGSMTDSALRAVHNETRASVIDQEYRQLAKRAGGGYGSRRQVIKAAAQRIVAEKAIRDIRPGEYLRAEQKNGREAFRALAKGDYKAAALAKQRQLLNHYLYRESGQAKQDVDSALRYFKRFDKKTTRQTITKAGSDYMEQIDSLLSRYELRRIPLRQIDRRASLAQWISEQQADGFDIDVPREVIDDSRQVNYQQIPLEEMRGMRDAIKQIEHLARLKDKLLSEQYKRTMQETADEIVSSIEAYHTLKDEPLNLAPTWRDRFIDGAKSYHAWHMKPEFITKWLDGNKDNGAAWRAIFKPLADAEDAEAARQTETSRELNIIMNRYTKEERGRWFIDKVHVAEVNTTFNKASLMATALNWGNDYNRQVLMEGHGWNQKQVEAVLSHLDKRDWETVQAMWDLIDGFWPDIQKMERDLNGITPEKVQASLVDTPHGQFSGGYYPIKYDSKASHKTWIREQKAGESLFENSYSKPATKQGHTKERQGSNGQRLRLDMNVLSEHISQVTHDITHRRAIVDVDRLLQRDDVRTAIERSGGREIYRQFRPWLSAIANEVQQPEHLWEKLIGQARAGATVVNMGMKITTAVVQPLGYLQSVDMIGPRYAWKGLQMFLGGGEGYERGMKNAINYVHDRSELMKNRQRTFDRDVRDTINRSLGRQRTTRTGQAVGRVLDPVQETAFYLTGMMDQATSIPTWLGAYQKALDGKIDGVAGGDERAAAAHGDAMVRQSQSAGGTKDLAAIQRGPQLRRAITMFYSYFSVLYNIGAERGSQIKRGDISIPQAAASALFLWFAPAMLGELVAGRGPEDDEEWAKWAATEAIKYPASSVIGFRDVVSAALDHYGYSASPAFDAFDSTAKTLKIPMKALDDEQELGRSDVKAALMTAGYWGKLPARQAWITGEYLYDVATGEDSPDSPQEFVRNLFFTRPADKRN